MTLLLAKTTQKETVMEFSINPAYLNKKIPTGFEFATLSISQAQSEVVLHTASGVQVAIALDSLSCATPLHATLPSKELKKALALFNKKEDILISLQESGLTLSQGSLAKTLKNIPNLRVLAITNTKPLLTLPKSIFKPFLDYMKGYIKRRDLRDDFKHLLFDNGNMVMTDGAKMLIHKTIPFDGYALIPYEAIATAYKLAKDSLSIEINETHAVIYVTNPTSIKIIAPLCTRKYPDWKRILLYKPRCHSFTLPLSEVTPLVQGSEELSISFNEALTTLSVHTDSDMKTSLAITYTPPTETPDYPLYPATTASANLHSFLQLAWDELATAYVNGHATQIEIPDYTLVFIAYQNRGE